MSFNLNQNPTQENVAAWKDRRTERHVLRGTSGGIAAEWVTRHTTTNEDGAGQGSRYDSPSRHVASRLHATLD